jgi:hypothetical protein
MPTIQSDQQATDAQVQQIASGTGSLSQCAINNASGLAQGQPQSAHDNCASTTNSTLYTACASQLRDSTSLMAIATTLSATDERTSEQMMGLGD